ncbi:MAG: DNA repair protein RecN [Clostridia bacterium]|nr:DNA repair protein RecN [Clostridia bacterium]
MLSYLQIENVAIIKEAVINLGDGFNVMTGETGAGKSIIIDSINAVLGERTSRELIRTGCDYAKVEAVFYENNAQTNACLEELGIPCEADGEILISRKMTPDGKNICKINGENATVSMLKRLGCLLVNIHGQADNQSLLNSELHLSYVDSVAGNNTLLEDYVNCYNEYTYVRSRLQKLNTDEEMKLRRLDILNYQINEIEKADITEGEYDSLKQKQAFFRNAEKLASSLNNAYFALNGDGDSEGAVSLGFSSANSLSSCSDINDNINEISKKIENSAYLLSECSDEIKELIDSLDFSEADINAVEERLDELYNIFRKYGKTDEEVLAFYKNAVEERGSIENADELRIKLEKELNELYNKAYKKAEVLSEARKKAGESFCKAVKKELSYLDMPSVELYLNMNKTELTDRGIDDVEFYLSANVGEEPKPLSKIASGGELSRIMLAIKCVLSEKDKINTLVFDEVDTGVSGSAAQKIAVKLKELSETHQVICVTHLAPIASYADSHLLITKSEREGKTYTQLEKLDTKQRVNELARIMGGNDVSELMLKNAEEMLIKSGVIS